MLYDTRLLYVRSTCVPGIRVKMPGRRVENRKPV